MNRDNFQECDERAASRGLGAFVPEGYELRRDEDGLALVGDGMVLRGDFRRLLPRARQGVLQKELLVRAAKVKGVEKPTAVDATAGLGEDAFLLAAAGFEVMLFESNPVIAALLRDAIERAQADADLRGIASRMTLVEADSVDALPRLEVAPDVIVLDPMFPEKRKSASSKKKMQLFQHLESPCQNEEALMRAALEAKPRKVVVKRPLKGPYLAGVKPNHSLEGKTVRYDCLVLPPR